jgi:hypothetical protein
MSHAGPAAPPLEDVELPEEPEEPDEPELPEEPEVPEEPLDEPDEPVSGVDESGVVEPASGVLVVFGGSFALLSAGVGSADFVSCTSAPSPSSGDVAHADMRATSDKATAGMRAMRSMAGTLAAELCTALACLARETLR